jgi:hypothetical protein
MLISVILLRIVSAMSTDDSDVNIIPNYATEIVSFSDFTHGGVFDALLSKLPSRFTREITIFRYNVTGF